MAEIETIIAKEGFWDNPEDTKSILKERTALSGKIDSFEKLEKELEENEILLDLAIEESDDEALQEVIQQIIRLEKKSDGLTLNVMLDGEDDDKNAIVSINAAPAVPRPRTGRRCCSECIRAGSNAKAMCWN